LANEEVLDHLHDANRPKRNKNVPERFEPFRYVFLSLYKFVDVVLSSKQMSPAKAGRIKPAGAPPKASLRLNLNHQQHGKGKPLNTGLPWRAFNNRVFPTR